MTPAEYKATQDRVELLARLIIDTDPEVLDEFASMGEHSDAIAPLVDPTAWMAGHDRLRMVIEHAQAIASARRHIVRAAQQAGAL